MTPADSPRLSDGYTRIANALLEALAKFRVPGEAMQVFLVVLRETYGWKNTSVAVSMGAIADRTGLRRPNVARAIRWLRGNNLLCVIKSDNTSHGNTLKINKKIKTWGVIKNDTPPAGVIKNDNTMLSKTITPMAPQPAPAVCPRAPKENKRKKEEVTEITNVISSTSGAPNFLPSGPSVQAGEQRPLAQVHGSPLRGTLPLCDGTDYPVSQQLLDELAPLYPAVDVVQELRAMKGWLIGNPANRKTRRGVLRFITSWLSRAQDRAPRVPQERPGSLPGGPVSYAQKQDQARRGLAAMVIAHDQIRQTHTGTCPDGTGSQSHILPPAQTHGNGPASGSPGMAGGLRTHDGPAVYPGNGQIPQAEPLFPEHMGHFAGARGTA